jgi:hypothetical protein
MSCYLFTIFFSRNVAQKEISPKEKEKKSYVAKKQKVLSLALVSKPFES